MIMLDRLEHSDLIVEYLIVRLRNNISSSLTLENYMYFLTEFNRYYGPLLPDEIDCVKKIINSVKGRKDIDVLCNDGKVIFNASYELTDDSEKSIRTFYIPEESREALDRYMQFIASYEFEKMEEYDTDDVNASALSSFITSKIYESDIKDRIAAGNWPKYAYDMERFLFGYDLSKELGLPSFKQKYMDLYHRVNASIGYMYYTDPRLKISNTSRSLLARYNYNRMVESVPEFDKAFKNVGITIDVEGNAIICQDLKTGSVISTSKINSVKNGLLRKNFLESE